MYPVIKRICLRVIFFWKKKNDDAHCLKIVIPSLCMCSPTYSLAPPPSPAPAPTPTAALEVLCSDLPSVSAVRWQPPGTVPSGSASLTLRPWSSWAALSQWLSTEGTRTWPLPLHPLKRSPLTGSYTLETPSPDFSSLSFSKHQIYITILRFSLPEPLPISLYLSQTLPTPPSNHDTPNSSHCLPPIPTTKPSILLNLRSLTHSKPQCGSTNHVVETTNGKVSCFFLRDALIWFWIFKLTLPEQFSKYR